MVLTGRLVHIECMKTVHAISRRTCLALGAGFAASFLPVAARAGTNPDVVVELFSSQGCNSCPPADRLFSELRQKPGVLALTYHVDYWDYLGWKDTLASPEFSQRQYDYAKARGDMDVYTPQMIINGGKPLVGSQRSEVYAVLEQSRQMNWPVDITMSAGSNEIAIDVGPFASAGAPPASGTLWVMPVLQETTVKIERGEVAGQDMTYNNVVRRLVPAGMWNGSADRISLPKDGLLPPDCTLCVALLQQGKVGRILGAAVWDSLDS